MNTIAPQYRSAWEQALAFHGHSCPGLALGCRLAVDALAHLGAQPSEDEELICIAETESCALDAVQVVAGCTMGKGNVFLRLRGKHAFSFYRRGGAGESEHKGIRLVWRFAGPDMPREEKIRYFFSAPWQELYTLTPLAGPLPPFARISASLACAACGELTAEPFLRLHEGRLVCLDCFVCSSRIL